MKNTNNNIILKILQNIGYNDIDDRPSLDKIKFHLLRIPDGCREDFISLLAVELLIEKRSCSKAVIDAKMIDQICDRIRHRLLRDIRRVQGKRSHTPIENLVSRNMDAKDYDKFDLADEISQRLTVRQSLVLHELMEGYDREEIAEKMSVSIKTIQRDVNVIREIVRKLYIDKS